ncbi:MAG: nickel/cobalt efflux transporter RcnA, partial [Gammaproteobacteria bacterium]|nr:nickel/cobalt efflux transporter RcnA [Gammaproteobacteria bacterium]
MSSFVTLLQQGNSWLFIPSAVLLGALHGLEPGHSKTMMAAFIVAIRGTLVQAVLLGLAATASHTAVVWAVALGGLYFGGRWNTEATEPYLQVVSAALIIAVAIWMMWRTWRHRAAAAAAEPARDRGHQDRGRHHPHEHDHDHGHSHGHEHARAQDGGDVRRIDTGHGVVGVQIFAHDAHARFRLHSESGATWAAD